MKAKNKQPLTAIEEAKLAALRHMKWDESRALAFLARESLAESRAKGDKKRPPSDTRPAPKKGDKPLLMSQLTDLDKVRFQALRHMGRSEKAALEWLAKDSAAERTLTEPKDDGGFARRRAAFEKHLLNKSQTNAARMTRALSTHNQGRPHLQKNCPACNVQRGIRS